MSDILTGTIPEGSTDQWRDKKRYLWLMGVIIPAAVLAAVASHEWAMSHNAAAFGHTIVWLGPVLLFVLVPLADLVFGLDGANPPEDIIESLENDKYYRWITYLFLPVQYVGFVVAFYLMTHGAHWSVVDKVGLSISLGVLGGLGINTAHELGHKRESVERWLSKIALAQTFYGHFYLEHNRGHHVRVATPEDPASSRLGENFYRFWPRTVFGSLKSAWHLEKKRYARKNTHPFHIGNDVLNAWLMSIVLWGAMTIWLGVGILPYLVIQGIFGFSLLEIVNYLEHYGMLRQKVGEGDSARYERVNPSHSWNSNNIPTNVLLYHLQRHSDHHANPTRRYQALRDFKESPVLPTGYAGMIVIAAIPPIWRRVMDQKVVDHFDGDITLANVQPGKLEKLLKKYPAPVAHKEIDHVDVTRQQFDDGVTAARCPGCGYTYEVAAGNELEGFAAGTAWSEIPNDWTCPDCGVREKVDFIPLKGALQ